MENRKVIIPIIFFIFLSVSFLIYRAEHMPEPKWWAIYFVNAKDQSLNFSIENNAEEASFHWQVLDGKNKLSENDVKLNKNETKNVILNDIDYIEKKIVIEVISNGEKREIYKNFGE